MARLRFIVEGQTESRFVETVLAPHLAAFGVYVERPQIVCTSRDRRTGKKHVGGLSSWSKVRSEIERLLKSERDVNCRFTTMFDYYALPVDFPGFEGRESGVEDPLASVVKIEQAMGAELVSRRMIPYIQLHEFETLVLASPQQLDCEYFARRSAIDELIRQTADFENPELIDGGYETAPSHRILRAIPEYDKVVGGVNVVCRIGIQTLKEKCLHFRSWLDQLEKCGVSEEGTKP